ncbi:hypothetical protein EVAR_3489_1 [Eumeta japonica]|uniref:Uncharacterized protein n=1 Tax=Eumeta variegata TaxID=151549 RepID=A0A4C1STB9_EUMVA|nr:hypothetical protein EVAR_3489_1 [Eumeta japonica]
MKLQRNKKGNTVLLLLQGFYVDIGEVIYGIESRVRLGSALKVKQRSNSKPERILGSKLVAIGAKAGWSEHEKLKISFLSTCMNLQALEKFNSARSTRMRRLVDGATPPKEDDRWMDGDGPILSVKCHTFKEHGCEVVTSAVLFLSASENSGGPLSNMQIPSPIDSLFHSKDQQCTDDFSEVANVHGRRLTKYGRRSRNQRYGALKMLGREVQSQAELQTRYKLLNAALIMYAVLASRRSYSFERVGKLPHLRLLSGLIKQSPKYSPKSATLRGAPLAVRVSKAPLPIVLCSARASFSIEQIKTKVTFTQRKAVGVTSATWRAVRCCAYVVQYEHGFTILKQFTAALRGWPKRNERMSLTSRPPSE